MYLEGRTKRISYAQAQGWRQGFWFFKTTKKDEVIEIEKAAHKQTGEADKEFTFKHAKFKMFLRTPGLLYQLGEPE